MDIVNSSPAGRVYMPSSPPPEAAYPSTEPFNEDLRRAFELFLEDDNNRTIFTQEKRAHYIRWLSDPSSKPIGNTPQEVQQDRNRRQRALSGFMLQQGQLYKLPGTYRGQLLQSRYVACYSDAFDIITRTHSMKGIEVCAVDVHHCRDCIEGTVGSERPRERI
jgi:hypothetical protein